MGIRVKAGPCEMIFEEQKSMKNQPKAISDQQNQENPKEGTQNWLEPSGGNPTKKTKPIKINENPIKVRLRPAKPKLQRLWAS